MKRSYASSALSRSRGSGALHALARSVTHDLNNLSGALMLHVERLRNEASASPDAIEWGEHLVETVQAAADTMRHLLLLSGGRAPRAADADLRQLLPELVGATRRVLGPAVHCDLTLAPPPMRVARPAAGWGRILLTLLLDLRHRLKSGDRISVVAEPKAASVEKRLGSTGPARWARISISAGDDDRTRAAAGGKARRVRGSVSAGVRSAVRRHGGRISCVRRFAGGERIVLWLPILASEATDLAGNVPEILVMERDSTVRQAVVFVLQQLNLRAREAGSESDALGVLRHGGVDMLLLDAALAGDPAGELAGALRTQSTPPVIVLMSFAADESPDVVLGQPVAAVLAKPMTLEPLRRVLAALLVRRDAREILPCS